MNAKNQNTDIENDDFYEEAIANTIKAKANSADDYSEVEAMARGLKSSFYRAQALSFIAQAACTNGNDPKAQALAAEVLEINGPKGEMAFFMKAIQNGLFEEAMAAFVASDEGKSPTPRLMELSQQFSEFQPK